MKANLRKRNGFRLILIVSVLAISALLLVLTVTLQGNVTIEEAITIDSEQTTSYVQTSVLNGRKFEEDLQVYETYNDKLLYYVYITVLPTKDGVTGESITLSDLNSVTSADENPTVEVIFQEGDSGGPYEDVYESTALIPNGVMRVRGFSARKSPQKSYKVKLSGATDDFLGQTVLNFNKHKSDPLRTANKFCMDAFETIPDIGSLNTYFVKIYIRDLSENSDTGYENYGLFTMVEQPNTAYLRRHGLDENGALYKAMDFGFADYYDEIVSESDPYYDEEAFEKVLEIAENADHDKLIEMIEAVNDESIDIDYTMSNYFNTDNYLTWMATNIIFGNIDAIVNNFLLYSPLNSKTWYFIPWDYDGTLLYTDLLFNTYQDYPESFFGIANFWNIKLHRRYYKNPDNLKALNDKIDMIMEEYLSRQDCKDLSSAYKSVLENAAFDVPDIENFKITADEMVYYNENIYDILKSNIDLYYANLEIPMPIFMDEVKIDDKDYTFAWDSSYDFQGDSIYYTLYISTDVNFDNVIYTAGPMFNTRHTVVMDLGAGEYFYKVLIQDEHGNKQINSEQYIDPLYGEIYWGVRSFVVE